MTINHFNPLLVLFHTSAFIIDENIEIMLPFFTNISENKTLILKYAQLNAQFGKTHGQTALAGHLRLGSAGGTSLVL